MALPIDDGQYFVSSNELELWKRKNEQTKSEQSNQSQLSSAAREALPLLQKPMSERTDEEQRTVDYFLSLRSLAASMASCGGLDEKLQAIREDNRGLNESVTTKTAQQTESEHERRRLVDEFHAEAQAAIVMKNASKGSTATPTVTRHQPQMPFVDLEKVTKDMCTWEQNAYIAAYFKAREDASKMPPTIEITIPLTETQLNLALDQSQKELLRLHRSDVPKHKMVVSLVLKLVPE